MFHFPFFDFLSQSPLKITLHDHVKKVAFYSSLNDKVQIAKTPGSSSELNIILSLNQQFYQMNTGIQTKTYTWAVAPVRATGRGSFLLEWSVITVR